MTSFQSAGFRFSNESPDAASTHLPATKFLKVFIGAFFTREV